MRIMFTLNENKPKEKEMIDFLNQRTCNAKDFIKETLYQYISSYGIIPYNSNQSINTIPIQVVKEEKPVYDEIKGLNSIEI